MQTSLAKKHEHGKMAMTVAFAVICIIYVLPILIVLMNSFKSNAAVNTETFAFPNEDSFVGFQNYIKGMTFGNYPFIKAVLYSLFITLVSSALILLCTSMAAWYVSRVGSLVSKIIYYLCVFSMVVPFQMVMFTLSRTAEQVKLPYFSFTSMAFAKIGLNTPWTIPIVYLGFGAGLAVFMFSGFVKTIPLEIEEAAVIDGCGPLRTFFLVVLPMMKPTFISVGVLEIMWVWNDFLLPYLVLDRTKYMTIPIVIQHLKGSYGQVDMGATMALILLSILPVIVFALFIGVGILKVGGERADILIKFFDACAEVSYKIIGIVMSFAPIGVFALLLPVVAKNGPSVLLPLISVIACVAVGCLIHAVAVYSTLAKVWGGHTSAQFFRGMSEAMLIAFTTCSSAAALPVNMKNSQEKLGVSRDVSSFVLPLGATINMDGTALYMGVCSLFIANVFGIDLSYGQMAMIVLTGTLASIGTAGVPGAGLIMLAMVLQSVNLPMEGLALVAGIDRVLDMFRTCLNITGDISCALCVTKWESKKTAVK